MVFLRLSSVGQFLFHSMTFWKIVLASSCYFLEVVIWFLLELSRCGKMMLKLDFGLVFWLRFRSYLALKKLCSFVGLT